jgi:hypothetical protein
VSPPPSAPSEPEAQQGKAHQQQPAKSKPAGKPASPPPTAKWKKPDREPKPKTDDPSEPGPPADNGQSADPGSQGKANGKNK